MAGPPHPPERLVFCALAFACATACSGQRQRATAPHTRPSQQQLEKPVAESPPDETLLRKLRARVAGFERLRCKTSRCCVKSLEPAGRTTSGHELAVLALADTTECVVPRLAPGPAPDEESYDPSLADASLPPGCNELWLVDVTLPDTLPDRRLAFPCSHQKADSDYAVDAGKQTLTVTEGSLFSFHVRREFTTIGLEPLRWVESARGLVAFGSGRSSSFDYDRFEGQVELGVDYCDGARPAQAPPSDADFPEFTTTAVMIPRAAVPAEFSDGGWKTTGLGTCAARVDGEHGLLAWGGGDAAGDTKLAVLFSSTGELFVEVEDDRFVAGASTKTSDHVQLWFASDGSACLDPKAKRALFEWKLPVTTSRAVAGFGRPTRAPAVELARDGRSARLRVRFERDWLERNQARFSVAYADSDDGVRIERVMATSALRPGTWWTLGEYPSASAELEGPSPYEAVSCRSQQGSLAAIAPPFTGLGTRVEPDPEPGPGARLEKSSGGLSIRR